MQEREEHSVRRRSERETEKCERQSKQRKVMINKYGTWRDIDIDKLVERGKDRTTMIPRSLYMDRWIER